MKNIAYKPTNYPSDLTDAQWERISSFFRVGNKSTVHKRSLVKTVLYIVKTGCQWRLLPHDYPKWSAVKSFYYRAIAKGIWKKVMQCLGAETRVNAGRSANPSYVLIDSQSVKTTADAHNRGTFKRLIETAFDIRIDISKQIKPKFEVLPKRSRVERTFSWLNNSRRLSKNYEIKTTSEKNIVMISHLHTLLKRL